MNLRTKTTWIIVGCLIVFTLSLHFLLSKLLDEKFEQLEQQRILLDTARAEHVLRMDIESLRAVIEDYAEWDDTYQFMSTHNPLYLHHEWQTNILRRFRMLAVVFLSSDGTVSAFKAVDNGGEELSALPPQVNLCIADHSASWQKEIAAPTQLAGIVLCNDKPFIVAAHPILTTAGIGPPRGLLLTFRQLDEATIANIAATAAVDLSISPLIYANVPLVSAQDQAAAIQIASHDATVVGNRVVQDIFGKPALLLTVRQEKTIAQSGEASKAMTVWSAATAGAVFFCCSFYSWTASCCNACLSFPPASAMSFKPKTWPTGLRCTAVMK